MSEKLAQLEKKGATGVTAFTTIVRNSGSTVLSLPKSVLESYTNLKFTSDISAYNALTYKWTDTQGDTTGGTNIPQGGAVTNIPLTWTKNYLVINLTINGTTRSSTLEFT